MKKTILQTAFITTLTVVFTFSQSFGQQLTYGPKLGLTLSTATGSGADGAGLKASFHIGGYGTYWVKDNMGIQAELLFNSLGFKDNISSTTDFGSGNSVSSTGTSTEGLYYVQIPVLFVYKVNALSFHVGPYLGILAGAHQKYSETETTTIAGAGTTSSSSSGSMSSTTGLNTIDFGFAIGATYELDNGVNFGVRLLKGLTNVASSSDNNSGATNSTSNTVNNFGIMVSVGYTLGKK